MNTWKVCTIKLLDAKTHEPRPTFHPFIMENINSSALWHIIKDFSQNASKANINLLSTEYVRYKYPLIEAIEPNNELTYSV